MTLQELKQIDRKAFRKGYIHGLDEMLIKAEEDNLDYKTMKILKRYRDEAIDEMNKIINDIDCEHSR